MTEVTTKAVEHGTELMVPGGCLLCGGDLPVRVTQAGAYSCCASCRWISKPQLRVTKEGIQIAHTVSAQA